MSTYEHTKLPTHIYRYVIVMMRMADDNDDDGGYGNDTLLMLLGASKEHTVERSFCLCFFNIVCLSLLLSF